jgi:hypothetical protein
MLQSHSPYFDEPAALFPSLTERNEPEVGLEATT